LRVVDVPSFLNDLERVTAIKYFPTDGTSALSLVCVCSCALICVLFGLI
jgi:hypothetical protein